MLYSDVQLQDVAVWDEADTPGRENAASDRPDVFIPTAKFLAAAQVMWSTISVSNPVYTVKREIATGPKAAALLGQVISNSTDLKFITCSEIESIVNGTTKTEYSYTPNYNVLMYHENIVPQLALTCGLTLPQRTFVNGLERLREKNQDDQVSKWFDPNNTQKSNTVKQNIVSAVDKILGKQARRKGKCELEPCVFHPNEENPVWKMVHALKRTCLLYTSPSPRD